MVQGRGVPRAASRLYLGPLVGDARCGEGHGEDAELHIARPERGGVRLDLGVACPWEAVSSGGGDGGGGGGGGDGGGGDGDGDGASQSYCVLACAVSLPHQKVSSSQYSADGSSTQSHLPKLGPHRAASGGVDGGGGGDGTGGDGSGGDGGGSDGGGGDGRGSGSNGGGGVRGGAQSSR